MDLKKHCEENNLGYILDEWDYELNVEDINNVKVKTKVYWKCSKNKNHSWQARIDSRITGNNCPYCSGKIVAKGENDLLTYCKENNLFYLIEEYDTDKNIKKIDEISPFTNKLYNWKCSQLPPLNAFGV